MLFLRSELINMLYATLPDREKHVIPGKTVVDVQQDDAGVQVSCADGSVFKADILIGCDGVRSVVRAHILQNSTEKPSSSANQPFECRYRCIFGSGPRPEGVEPFSMIETHNQGALFQLLSSEDRTYWLFYTEKERGEPVRRYTAEDCEANVQGWMDHPVSEGAKATFGDLWRVKWSANEYDLEEGVVDKWYRGRVVILGDSTQKVYYHFSFPPSRPPLGVHS
jgi:2-polyprenyl-6-methoxyphenol hydroxylase-like FAD-dependent oxidoreductase